MKKTPTIGNYFDDDEEKIIQSIENTPSGNTASNLDKNRLEKLQQSARMSQKEPRTPIYIRVRDSDLEKIKSKAEKEGLPYQTLINSILHKAANE